MFSGLGSPTATVCHGIGYDDMSDLAGGATFTGFPARGDEGTSHRPAAMDDDSGRVGAVVVPYANVEMHGAARRPGAMARPTARPSSPRCP